MIRPASQTYFLELKVRHVCIDVIVINMSQIHLVRLEKDDKIRIIANQMFGYASIRLTEVETIHAL